MNYTFFAVGSYIVMRALQVLLEGKEMKPWQKILMKGATLLALYAGLASMLVWYKNFPFLGFRAG